MIHQNKKIVIGGAQFGNHYGIANTEGVLKSKDVKIILDFAHKNGISSIDTAKSYGGSEKIIGDILSGLNQEWNVITKLNNSSSSLENQYKSSMNNLRVLPYAVLSHSYEDFMSLPFYKLLKKLKKDHKLKKIGVSVYTAKQIESILKTHKPDLIQCPLNILDTRLYKSGVLDRLKGEGIEIHARSLFLQGLFYLSKSKIKKKFPELSDTFEELYIISKEAGVTIAELSLLWVSSLKQIDKIVIGVDSIDQLKMHIATLNKKINKITFDKALKLNFKNEKILNPTFW